ncbi:MAG: hypothetical protein K5892_03050 [Acholeplasmatales bacterium]|nr:hypothetical protein [Acholeplasmatales bacterium]
MSTKKEKKVNSKKQQGITNLVNDEFDQKDITTPIKRPERVSQAAENKRSAALIEKIKNALEDLSTTAIDNKCDQVQKSLIKDAVKRCETLNVFDNVDVAETICSFLMRDIKNAKTAINQGNYLAINAQLYTVKDTLEHAESSPYFYKDPNSVKILISRNKVVTQKHFHQSELFSLVNQIKSYKASYKENPERYKGQMNMFAKTLMNIQESINNKTKVINEDDNKIKFFDYALDSVKIAAENIDSGIKFDIDDIIKTAELSKADREQFKEKMADALSSIKQDNSKVSNEDFEVDDEVISSSSKAEEEVENIFKMY